MRGVQVLVRAVLGIAIVAAGISGAVLPAYADPAEPPSAPVHVMVSNATLTTLDVSWTAPVSDGGAAVTGYTINYRKVDAMSWTTGAPGDPTDTSITVTGLDPDSSFQFRVAAVNSAGTGPWSGEKSTIGAGDRHSCAAMTDGTVTCWGYNEGGQLGDESTTTRLVPVQVTGITGLTPALTAISVSAGSFHSCALMANGAAKCWGWNTNGQLGNNSITNSFVPVPVWGIDGLTPSTTAVSITAGFLHSCALMANGTITCWGYNWKGQLGDGTTTDKHVPTQVEIIDGITEANTAVSVHLHFYHSCAAMADGTATCWGENNYGQLGNNSTTNSTVPVRVSGIDGADDASTTVSVSTGGQHSCALMANGTAICWGSNGAGQLGNNSTTSSPVTVPVAVSGIDGSTQGSTAVSVRTGDYHSCALMADDSVTCWGFNGYGQLGDNSAPNSSVPVLVPGITQLRPASHAVSLSTGAHFSCALLADATAACWGGNAEGELGDNSTTDSHLPVRVLDVTGPGSSFGRTLVPLSRPQQVIVTGRDAESIAIRWNEPAHNGGKNIDDYKVNYRPKGSPSWTAFAIVPYSQLHLRVRNLRAGVTYEFQVRAHNADGLGVASRVVSETVPVQASAPVVVDKNWDNRAITLRWRAVRTPAHSPVTGYVVSCQDRRGDTFPKEVGPAALSASIRVPAAQSYSCRVAARTDAGRGVGSERVQISGRIRD